MAAAAACAAVFGIGVPLFWVWVASQAQPTGGQGTSDLAAAIVIVGPLASYFVLVSLAGRVRGGEAPRQQMAWMRSRDEVRESARSTTSFEQVLILATFMMFIAFNVWFFALASCSSALC